MKKKIFIIFGVILILISAFQNKIFAYNPVIDGAREYMSDMLEDMQNNGEISQELYEDLQKQANTELTKAEMTQQLKENLFFFAVGQYANIAEDVVADSLLGLSDIWNYIFWDNDSQSFGFDEDTGDYIKNGLQSIIYDEGTIEGPVVGGWYECPFKTDTYFQSNYLRYLDFVEGPNVSAPVYVCFYTGSQSGNHYVIFASFVSGQDSRVNQYYSSDNGNIWQYSYAGLSLDSVYRGSETVGYFVTQNLNFYNAPYNLFPFYSEYGNQNDALADLFGQDWTPPSGEPALNGKGIIVNENPVFPSLSPLGALSPNYKNIVINNYNNGNSYPPNRGLNVNYYDYDYNYDVPFWGGQELESLEYPQEIEFPSIEFETIAIDENVDTAIESLDGGWLVKFFLVAILLLILGLIL